MTRRKGGPNPGGSEVTVIDDADGIELFRLLSVRKMIEIEGRGLRFKGGSVKARIARQLGLPARAKREVVLTAISDRIEELNKRREATRGSAKP